MSHFQWKTYFSMHVLGQTHPVLNNTMRMGEWYHHQSCAWLATVLSFEVTTTYYWKEKFSEVIKKVVHFPRVYYDYQCKYRCYHCDHPCQVDYCDYCIANPCWECGRVECGGFCELDRCPCEGGKGDRCSYCKHSDSW